MAKEQTQQGDVMQRMFGVNAEDDNRLAGLIQLAYEMGNIPEPSI